MKIAYGNVFTLTDTTVTEDASGATGYPETRAYDNWHTLLYVDGSASQRYFKANLTGHSTVPTVGFIGYSYSDTNVEIEWSDNDADWTSVYNDSETNYQEFLTTALQKNYWRFTIDATPSIAEILCHQVVDLPIRDNPGPFEGDRDGAEWTLTVGGGQRAAKIADTKRVRRYVVQTLGATLQTFTAAIRDKYHEPIWVKDHNDDIYIARLTAPVNLTWISSTLAEAPIEFIEI
jgi:hypothetical protein